MLKLLISFDYSLLCPCMCLSTNPGFRWSSFWYLTSVKKNVGSFLDGKIIGLLHKEYKNDQERYDNISESFIKVLDFLDISNDSPVFIENYSFHSKGKVFGLAENMGILKWKLFKRGHDIISIPPTSIKKFATKSGAAKKDDMYNAFFYKTQIDLHTNLTPHKKLGSPVTDIVDVFFISEYGHEMMINNSV